jgi:hypothetical protein
MNKSPYVGKQCRYNEHVCYIGEHGTNQVELVGEGFAEPYHVATFGNAVMAGLVTSEQLVIIGSAMDNNCRG